MRKSMPKDSVSSYELLSYLPMLMRWAARRNGILGRMAVTF